MMCRPGSLWPESCGPHIDRGLDVLTFDFIGVRWYEPDFIADQALQLLRSWFLILYEESCGQESWDFILLWQMLEVSCVQNMLVFWRQSIKRIALDIRTIRRTHRGKNLLIADAVRFCKPNPYKFKSQPSWTQTTHYKFNSDLGKIKVKLPQT